MKTAKKIISGLIFLGLFLLCHAGFRWLLVDDTKSYTRLMLHEFYQQPNIDIIFVGSSHCYGALDPEITDEIFGLSTFNAGSSLQAQDASFALIREAVERYQVKHIYMEMYYLMMSNDEYQDREQLTGTYIVSDYMRSSFNKIRFLLEASSPKYYINSFLPERRNWENLLHPETLREIVAQKNTPEYKNYQPFAGYREKGFVTNQDNIPWGFLLDTAGYDRIHTENPSADWLKTIRAIIDYCEKKGVELTLFSAPMTLFQTAGVGNYDEYIAIVHELTEGTSVEYVDFNLCREEYFDGRLAYYADAGHLNETGAAVFSRLFAEYFTGKIDDETLFYSSMVEKFAAAEPQILGLSYIDSGNGARKMKIVSTLPEDSLWTVSFIDTDGNKEILREKDPNPYFEILQTQHGTIRLNAGEISAEIEV